MSKSAGQQDNLVSIAEVAEALGYTRQHIGQTVKKLPIEVIKKHGNHHYLTAAGADRVAAHFGQPPVSVKILASREPEPEVVNENRLEPESEPFGTNQNQPGQSSEMHLALEILQKQLEDKQKTIEENRKTIDTLLTMIADKDSQIKELSSGYVAEKTAESLERGRAALAPIEEEAQEQPRKISLGQRFKFFFTGEL